MCNLKQVSSSLCVYLFVSWAHEQSFSILQRWWGQGDDTGQCKRYYLKSRYLIILLYPAPSAGPTTEQKLSKCLKYEQSSLLQKLTAFIEYRKGNLTLGNQMVGQVNHNKNRQYTLSQQDHNKVLHLIIKNRTTHPYIPYRYTKAGQTRHSELILFLNPSQMYCFQWSSNQDIKVFLLVYIFLT